MDIAIAKAEVELVTSQKRMTDEGVANGEEAAQGTTTKKAPSAVDVEIEVVLEGEKANWILLFIIIIIILPFLFL